MANATIKKYLLPFSALYGLVVWLRNKLFDWKILPTEEFLVPVICVGNITVGGTGKTPHVEYLLHLLTKQYKVAVLSRGYKRKSSGFVLADEKATAGAIGDEPFQMFRKFPQAVVAVDANRRRGIKKLLSLPENKKPQIILLDDAFQHRYVEPSCSILLIDSNRLIYEDALLPAGRLREYCSGKDRADAIIVTKCSSGLKPVDYRLISKHLKLYPYQSLFFTAFEYGELIPCFEDNLVERRKLQEIKENGYAVLLIAGIANPEGLISELKMYTHQLETLLFPDHHAFSKDDILKIETKFEQLHHHPILSKEEVECSELPHYAAPKSPSGDLGVGVGVGTEVLIVTTEKDFVRLIDCDFPEEMKKAMFYLPVTVVFKNNEETLFTKKIYEHVRSFK